MWLSTSNLSLKDSSRKLSPRFIGPFRICRIINPVAVRLSLPASLQVHPVFHVSQLKPVQEAAEAMEREGSAAPRLVDGAPAYTVRRILHSHRRGRGLQYLLDWEGYGPEHRSWVSSKLVLDKDLIRDFHRQHPEEPSLVARRRR